MRQILNHKLGTDVGEAFSVCGVHGIPSFVAHPGQRWAAHGVVEKFGESPYFSSDIERLSTTQRKQLIQAHAITGPNDRDIPWSAEWRVEKRYHWTQTFPAHGVVHIRHEYTPVTGNSNTIGDPSIYHGKDAVSEYAESCPAPAVRNSLAKVWSRPRGPYDGSALSIQYVSFILTTANTWKTPIEDFTLIVERPLDSKYKSYISFCWDGPVTQVDVDHFSAHVTGLVPKKELMIGYIWASVK